MLKAASDSDAVAQERALHRNEFSTCAKEHFCENKRVRDCSSICEARHSCRPKFWDMKLAFRKIKVLSWLRSPILQHIGHSVARSRTMYPSRMPQISHGRCADSARRASCQQ